MTTCCAAGNQYEQTSTLKTAAITTARVIVLVAAVALGFFCGGLIGAGIGLAVGGLGFYLLGPSKSEESAKTEDVFRSTIPPLTYRTTTQRGAPTEGSRSRQEGKKPDVFSSTTSSPCKTTTQTRDPIERSRSRENQGVRRRKARGNGNPSLFTQTTTSTFGKTPGGTAQKYSDTVPDRTALERIKKRAPQSMQDYIEALSKQGRLKEVRASIEKQKDQFIKALTARKIEKTKRVLKELKVRTTEELEKKLEGPFLEAKKRVEISDCIYCPLITIEKGIVRRNSDACVSISSRGSNSLYISVSPSTYAMTTPKYYRLELKDDGRIYSGGVHLGVLKGSKQFIAAMDS